jgi:hypothetical protein
MATYESCGGMNSSQLTSYAEVFPASRTLSPGSEEPPTTTATSGPKCSESFAQLSPDGCWLKMYEGCFHPRLDGSLEEFSETWPRAGILSGGTAYQRQPWVRRIAERESSSSENWPTPKTRNRNSRQAIMGGHPAHPSKSDLGLEQAAEAVAGIVPVELRGPEELPLRFRAMWPTPMQSDGAGGCVGRSGGEDLRTATKGSLNPDWVECLMGFPVGWTRLDTHGPQDQGKNSTTGSRRE